MERGRERGEGREQKYIEERGDEGESDRRRGNGGEERKGEEGGGKDGRERDRREESRGGQEKGRVGRRHMCAYIIYSIGAQSTFL